MPLPPFEIWLYISLSVLKLYADQTVSHRIPRPPLRPPRGKDLNKYSTLRAQRLSQRPERGIQIQTDQYFVSPHMSETGETKLHFFLQHFFFQRTFEDLSRVADR